MLAGLLMVLGSGFSLDLVYVFAPLVFLLLTPVVYSFFCYRKLHGFGESQDSE